MIKSIERQQPLMRDSYEDHKTLDYEKSQRSRLNEDFRKLESGIANEAKKWD